MTALGYAVALILAAALAGGATALIDGVPRVGRTIYLFLLGFVGLFAGARLFGAFGTSHYLSFSGPAVGGFYLLTGLVGGLVLVGIATLTLRRQAAGVATTMASQGIHDPRLAHVLFADARSAPLWLGIRLYIGYAWLAAGYEKVTGTGWMTGGASLKGYWSSATAIPATGKPAITYGWFRAFLTFLLRHQSYVWFAKLIAVGEVLVGLGLLVGCLVGFAAFFGALMNFSYMLAGSASTNPVLFALAIALILGWKVAGYWGFDRVLLPVLGAPWSPGKAFTREEASAHRRTPSPA
jgi:thiosulfate dehydrogenase (quinone) large subunit